MQDIPSKVLLEPVMLHFITILQTRSSSPAAFCTVYFLFRLYINSANHLKRKFNFGLAIFLMHKIRQSAEFDILTFPSTEYVRGMCKRLQLQ